MPAGWSCTSVSPSLLFTPGSILCPGREILMCIHFCYHNRRCSSPCWSFQTLEDCSAAIPWVPQRDQQPSGNAKDAHAAPREWWAPFMDHSPARVGVRFSQNQSVGAQVVQEQQILLKANEVSRKIPGDCDRWRVESQNCLPWPHWFLLMLPWPHCMPAWVNVGQTLLQLKVRTQM